MKKILLLIVLITFVCEVQSQNNFHANKEYIKAKNYFLNSKFIKFKDVVKKELGKKDHDNVFIDLANKIIEDLDSEFKDNLTMEQIKVLDFTSRIEKLHSQNRYYEIYKAYESCTFLDKLSSNAYYYILSATDNIAPEKSLNIIKSDLISNGENYRVLWTIGSNFSLGQSFKLWKQILSDPFFDKYSSFKSEVLHLSENIPELGLNDWASYVHFYGLQNYLKDNSIDSYSYRRLGHVLKDLNRIEEAKQAYLKSYKLNPFYLKGSSMKDAINCSYLLNKHNEASVYLDEFVGQQFLDEKKIRRTELEIELLLKSGDKTKARSKITFLLSKNKENQFAIRKLAEIEYSAGRYKEALRQFKLLHNDFLIEDLNLYNDYVFTLVKTENYEELLELWQDFSESNSIGDETTYYRFFDYFNKIEEKETALEILAEGLKLFPYSAWLLRNSGNLKKELGKFEEAKKDLLESIEIAPNNSWAISSFKDLLTSRGEVVEEELRKVFNKQPYSYSLQNSLKSFKEKEHQIDFLKSFTKDEFELVKHRNIYITYPSGSKESINFLKANLSISKTPLDSLFYSYLLLSEETYASRKRLMSKEILRDAENNAKIFYRLGGNKETYHLNKSYLNKAQGKDKLMVFEAEEAINTSPINNDLIRESIMSLGNRKKGFSSLRKSLEKDLYDYDNLERYIWINTKYNGSSINAIWAYNKCKELFPDKSCSAGNYFSALETLGDAFSRMKDYKKDKTLGTTNRYINWYNSTRHKVFDSKNEVVYNKNDNSVTILKENGEIVVKQDDPYTSKPSLIKKGNVWVKYEYTDSGELEQINSSSGKKIKFNYGKDRTISSIRTSDYGILNFSYSESRKPINIVLNNTDSLFVKYDDNDEIQEVTSNKGHKTALRVTQIFQEILNYTSSYEIEDLNVQDEKYSKLKEKCVVFDEELGNNRIKSVLDSKMIVDYKNYVSYLKDNLSNDANYATEALDVSLRMYDLIKLSEIDISLKEELLDFTSYFHEILKKIRRRGVAKNYWDYWIDIMQTLELEKLNQRKLNSYRKKIEILQGQFSQEPIKLLSSAEWLPKSSFNNKAYWTTTNLENLYPNYDFSNTQINDILKRKNGDIVATFNNGISIKKNGFWKFLYFDALNKKMIQNKDLIKISSKVIFNSLTETARGDLFLNNSSGTYLVSNDYSSLQRLKIEDDNYIGNNLSNSIEANSNLVLYNQTTINIISINEKDYKLLQTVMLDNEDIKKIKVLPINEESQRILVLTSKGIKELKKNENDSYKFVDVVSSNIPIKYFETDSSNVYYVMNNKLFKKSISNKDSKVIEVYSNIIFNKEIFGLCKIPVEENQVYIGVITDQGINIYRDNHFELFKIEVKNGLDQLTSRFYNNNSEFGIITKQKLIQFSLDDYYYSTNIPKKIKHLKGKGITLTLVRENLYYSNNNNLFDNQILTDGWGTKISDFDIHNNEVYLSDYRTVYKVTFNDSLSQTMKPYKIEKIFDVSPFEAKEFYIKNDEIKQIKVGKDGTVWVNTELSVFRNNPSKTPVLKEFNFIKNEREFPAKTLNVFKIIETYEGEILIVNSSEPWNNYKGMELSGGLVVYDKLEDKFKFTDNKTNIPKFPWFITSYTEVNRNEAIVGTSNGFAYHSEGGIKYFRDIENKSYLDIENKHKNLFLGTEGVKFGDFFLFGCAEGIIAYKDNYWFFPDRLNQLLPDYSKFGKWGGNKVNAIEVDHLQRLNISTDLGLLIINSNKIDPYDLLLMSRDSNKMLEYHNIEKLKKEREIIVGSLPSSSSSKKIVDNVISLKDKIKNLEKLKNSFAKGFKLKETTFKTINIDSIDTEINRITRRHSELLLTLKEKNPVVYQTLKLPPLGLAGIRRKLNANECIVQYIPLTNKLIIQIVSKEKLILKEVNVGKDELFNLSLIASDMLSGKKIVRGAVVILNNNRDSKQPKLEKILEQLYNNLISPIQNELLPYKNRVQIITEGALNYIPFESLISKNGKGKNRYAIEDYKFVYLSSLYMLQLLNELPEVQNNSYLLIGDPDNSLPHARKEVEEISKKISQNHKILIGKKAKIKEFRNNSRDKGIIHLATHGYVDKEKIRDSWLLFSDSKLKLSEVYELNLEKTDLMVLSACETALGKDGIETTTLARAFANAGVQNLIASLWKVNDESTKILMSRFYDEVNKGNSYVDALHAAQLHLKKYNGGEFKSPKYWAPFILIGKH